MLHDPSFPGAGYINYLVQNQKIGEPHVSKLESHSQTEKHKATFHISVLTFITPKTIQLETATFRKLRTRNYFPFLTLKKIRFNLKQVHSANEEPLSSKKTFITPHGILLNVFTGVKCDMWCSKQSLLIQLNLARF